MVVELCEEEVYGEEFVGKRLNKVTAEGRLRGEEEVILGWWGRGSRW